MKLTKIIIAKVLLSYAIVSLFSNLQANDFKKNTSSILALGMEMSNMRDMLKSYILIGAKIKYKNPTKKLKNGITHYEHLLDEIKTRYPHDPIIQSSIQNSLNAWIPVKEAMELGLQNESLEKMKKGAIFIHGNIRTVIKELSHMKKHLLHKSTIKNKEALNASIEIAASARRLSAHYMMDLWHLDDPTIQKHWDKGLKIYADSLVILKQSPFIKNHHFHSLLKKSIKLHKYFTRMGKKAKIYSILIDKKADMAFKQAEKMSTIILQATP
jgi:3-methyladenine DNA glycosylase AlkC